MFYDSSLHVLLPLNIPPEGGRPCAARPRMPAYSPTGPQLERSEAALEAFFARHCVRPGVSLRYLEVIPHSGFCRTGGQPRCDRIQSVRGRLKGYRAYFSVPI